MKTKYYIFVLAMAFLFTLQGKTSSYPEKQLDEILKPEVDGDHWSGVILMEKNGMIIKKAYGMMDRERQIPNRIDTRFRLGRTSTIFTALSVLKLVEEGKMNLNDRLSKYLPHFPNGDIIAIHHLLSHSSGLPDLGRLMSNQEFESIRTQPFTLNQLLAIFRDQPLEFVPAELLENNRFPQPLMKADERGFFSAPYLLLTAVIEEVSGSDFESFVENKVLVPLKMSDSGFLKDGKENPDLAVGYRQSERGIQKVGNLLLSNFRGTHSMYSTVPDLYKLYVAFREKTLLNPEMLNILFHPYSGDSRGHRFCYGWAWIMKPGTEKRILYTSSQDDGLFVNLVRQPEEGLAMILLGNIGNLPHWMRPPGAEKLKLPPRKSFLPSLFRLLEATGDESPEG